MNFLRAYSCTVLRYCSYNSINSVIKRCSHTFDKQEHDVPQNTVKSVIYPDYQIIYMLPYIKHASVLNKIKRNWTIFTVLSIPVIGILTMENLIMVDEGISNIACSFALAAIMQFLFTSCNNLIGAIYYKKDENKIIISYSSYWGNRVNLSTDVNDVTLQRITSKIPRTYRNIYVKSQEKNLKIFIRSENIVDEFNFYKTFNVM